MSDHSDYLEIYQYEIKIEELVNHHIQKYKYVGEDGREYRVIQAVFHELNRLPELSNRHIRWYSIIIGLIDNFFNLRMRMGDGLPGFSSLPLEFAGGFKMRGQVRKSRPEELFLPVFVPPYISIIEVYIKEIARIGVLVSTKEKISPGYLDYKFGGIELRLKDLLSKLETRDAIETKEEVFILAIKNATDNAAKLRRFFPGNISEVFKVAVNSETYERLIIKRIESIDRERLASYYNLDDFWNGFIP
jgi:hypothetical protein